MNANDRDRMARRLHARAIHLATRGTARDVDPTYR
jgi:hypothetical protein